MILISHDITIPFRYFFFFAYPDLFSNLYLGNLYTIITFTLSVMISKSMRYIIIVLLHKLSIYDHFLTWLMSLKSWETNTKPPSKLLIASARASMVSMSKWLVGSSSSSICGDCHAIQAKTTRHRWPSLNCFSGDVCKKRQYTYLCFLWMVKFQSSYFELVVSLCPTWAFPDIPYLPITFLISSRSLNSGNIFNM